jgi:hypothetical protein
MRLCAGSLDMYPYIRQLSTRVLSNAPYVSIRMIRTQPRFRQIPKKMSAWQLYKYGPLSELTLSNTVHVPVIRRPGHVLVEVHAASVNPVDVMMVGK